MAIGSTDDVESVLSSFRDRPYGLLVDGKLVPALSGAEIEAIDPSTGAVVTSVPESGPADVERAAVAAERAQPAWSRLGVDGRAAHITKLRELIVGAADDLALADSVDGGIPLRAAQQDVELCLAYIDSYLAMGRSVRGEVLPDQGANVHYTRFAPYGVVGRLTAFNHPILFAATRILAGLIMGNAVVLKVSPQTPLSPLVLAPLFAEALPAGVVSVLTGGASVGEAIVKHPGIKRIGFTGSAETGLRIQRTAADSGSIKDLSLELGGKNAMLVFPDSSIAEAVDGAVKGMNFKTCQGQSCGSMSRILVHRSLYRDFVEAFAQELQTIQVGRAYVPSTDMGPLISAEHLTRVRDYIRSGRTEGATVVVGGEHTTDSPVGGFYCSPTLFADVSPSMRIAREEIFGPVVSVLPWDTTEEAVKIANDVDLGLAASIWSNDMRLVHQMIDQLEAGYVWVNDVSAHYMGMPFGGMKNSGLGREECLDEMKSYVETKSVHLKV